MRCDGFFGAAKSGIARQSTCRDPDRQRVDNDPVAECRTKRERDPVADEGRELRGEQRRHCRSARHPEDGLGCDGERHIRVETGERAGRGANSPMPIREWSGPVYGQRERRTVGAAQQAVEQDAGRLARVELEP